MPMMLRSNSAKARGIHNGAVTHIHDQAIKPVSLRNKNKINSKPVNVICINLLKWEWFIFFYYVLGNKVTIAHDICINGRHDLIPEAFLCA